MQICQFIILQSIFTRHGHAKFQPTSNITILPPQMLLQIPQNMPASHLLVPSSNILTSGIIFESIFILFTSNEQVLYFVQCENIETVGLP